MRTHNINNFLLVFLSVTTFTTFALDDHFFRASWTPSEPRFERDFLCTLAAPIRLGSTYSSYNCNGHKVPLFDLYGNHTIAQLAQGAQLDPLNPTDKLFIDLAQEAALKNSSLFGTVSFSGKQRLAECFITAEQNLTHGFFLAAYLPMRVLHLGSITMHDLTNPRETTPTWRTVKEQLPSFLADRYNLHLYPCHTTSFLCDAYIMGGWTYNNENTTTFDYVDTTLQAGIVTPCTKSGSSYNSPFTLQPSTRGHLGFPIRTLISGGLFEWLTIGGSFDTTLFVPEDACLRLKTAPEQQGLIFLASDKVHIHQGALLNVSTYLKVDHIGDVFSLLFGYSYAKKNADTLTSCSSLQEPLIVYNDARWQGWNMHTLHFMSEYDFSKEINRFGPRVGLFYNYTVAGKSVINSSMAGGLFGLEIALDLP